MVSENSTSVYQTSSYKQEENNTELNEEFFVNLYPKSIKCFLFAGFHF